MVAAGVVGKECNLGIIDPQLFHTLVTRFEIKTNIFTLFAHLIGVVMV